MVDYHPEKTLSTEAEPRWTMISEGLQSTMSSRKEWNIYFIIQNVPISLQSACTSVPSHIWLKYRRMWRKTPINSNSTQTWQLQLCVIKKCVHRMTFNFNITRFYDVGQYFIWMIPVAMTLIRMPRRPPLVSRFEYYEHLFHAVNIFFWMLPSSRSKHFFSERDPPLYILCNNCVTFKTFKQTTDQWKNRT